MVVDALNVDDLRLEVGEFRLKDVSLAVAAGEYFCLLGANGAGKTLLIESVCGLVCTAAGRILIGGRDVTSLASRFRGVGFVPQDFGLFPHLSVEENIIFPLRVRGLDRGEAIRKAAPLIEMLDLQRLLGRGIGNLSGGERQKTALARALATEPKLLLLDEPMSTLDEASRGSLCAQLRRIQRDLQIAVVHVTHMMEVARTVSDRAAILADGRLVQTGTMTEMLDRPASEAIARFMGIENVYAGDAEAEGDGCVRISFAGHSLAAEGAPEGRVSFMIRPESVSVCEACKEAVGCIRARLERVENRKMFLRLEFDAGERIVVCAHADAEKDEPTLGRDYSLRIPPDGVYVFERQ